MWLAGERPSRSKRQIYWWGALKEEVSNPLPASIAYNEVVCQE